MDFKFVHHKKPRIKNPILIEGLPGIGNVGKIAIDFIIENLKAKKIISIESYNYPHSVFVNEDNMIELPVISIYHKKIRATDFLFLVGDIQPISEVSCYEFCDALLDFLESHKCKGLVTTGGIGLQSVPKHPKVFVTGTDQKYINTFKGCNKEIYGVVGPIMGVTGILLGLAGRRKIPSAALLTQTMGHPAYLGVKGARELLRILEKRFKLQVDIKQLSDEIDEIEEEIRAKAQQLADIRGMSGKPSKDMSYFG
jgi:uncharacterized protein (TIGR00162 family)